MESLPISHRPTSRAIPDNPFADVMLQQFLPENIAPKKIASIQFGMLDGQAMENLSEVSIINRELYQHPNGVPVPYGPLDEHLGTSNKRGTCKTCGQNIEGCPGHFGYTRLSLPSFHIGYIKCIYNTLKMICKSCSRVLLEPQTRTDMLRRVRSKMLDFNQRKDLNAKILKLCQSMQKCCYCNEFNGEIKRIGPLKFLHRKFKLKASDVARSDWQQAFQAAIHYSPEISHHLKNCGQDMNPLVTRQLFIRIPAEDCELLGMSQKHARPESMILTHLLVPPCAIRPSVQMDQQGGSNEDDLTMKLQEIIWISDLIQMDLTKGTAVAQIMDRWEVLQLQVSLYINSEFPGIPLSVQTKKPIRGLCQRLKGKQGRFRGNLSGKRVDFTSRTVISPDPNLHIEEVGVPIDVATTLTYPERVNQYNLEYMRILVINGPSLHPGAISILYPQDGSRRLLKYGDRTKVAAELQIGDIIERHLHDGDIVLFNRQPSLHRISIMAHRARVMNWKTFRFNECVCAPYNADFDGDEMNLHLPQTEEARAEALQLLGVTQNLAVPKSGELLISATQDFLTASWIITSKDSFYSPSKYAQVISCFLDLNLHFHLPTPAILKPLMLYTGKQIFSVLIQPHPDVENIDINLQLKLRNYDNKMGGEIMTPNDTYLVIHNGFHMCGQLDKSVLGGGRNTLFSNLLKYFSPCIAADRMSKLAQMCARYLGDHGFSIGISDVTPDANLVKRKKDLVSEGYAKCDEFIQQFRDLRLEQEAGATLDQTLESRLEATLSDIRDAAGKICIDELNFNDRLNSPLVMTLCGSKGSKINVSQMVACVGQQTVNGRRIPNGFFERTLPHFDFGSKHPSAKGFVSNSFYSGLTPTEFFFHTMGGREGLVDTAVKTAETGYMQRRLMKALEDYTINYDGTVRASGGKIIQFKYGDDGIEPTHTETQSEPFDLSQQWQHSLLSTLSNDSQFALKPYEIIQYVQDRLITPIFLSYTEKFHRDLRDHFMLDFPLLNNTPQLQDQSNPDITKLEDPAPGQIHHGPGSNKAKKSGVIDQLIDIRRNLGLDLCVDPPLSIALPSTNSFYTLFDTFHDVKEELYSQLVHISKSTLDNFFSRLIRKYQLAQAEPGTAVGALCGQSIGEPCTQMTLKTFHFAGVASMNITLGVPRIREIINATKTISTPIIEVKLQQETSKEFAKLVKARIERTTLGEIAAYIKQVYQPQRCFILIKLDLNCVRDLYLSCDTSSVAMSILATRKLKLKPEHVSVVGKNRDKIMVIPPDSSLLRQTVKQSQLKQNVYFTLQKMKTLLSNVVACGLSSIKRCVIREDLGKDGAPNRYSILVDGQDLLGVMTQEGVKYELTKSNHLLEVQRTLGIEAARKSIIDEIAYTMKSHGVYVDPRHLNLLADCMTSRGETLGITRFGISKMNDSALMLASFEKTTDYLFDAGQRALTECISGVSECIIMGRPIPLGTSLFEIMHKSDFIKSNGIAFEPKPLLLQSA